MRNLIPIFFLLFSAITYSQNETDSSGLKRFNQGLAHYENGNLDSALIIWIDIVENEIGKKYDTYGNAFYNVASVYWSLRQYDKAKEWYLKILASDLNDFDETGSLMEPHTNYKHKSALGLAGLYQIDSNYVQVLYWIDMADTVYRYWGFEGSATSISKRQAYLLNSKVEVLIKLNRKDEAIRAIIIELICARGLELFFRIANEKLMTLINPDNFKKDFETALDSMLIVEIDNQNWYGQFTLNNLIYKIPFTSHIENEERPHYWRYYRIPKGGEPKISEVISEIKNRDFYKKL